MIFDFTKDNFEKGRVHFREGTKKFSRSIFLFQNGDWAGSVEASQHAIEFFIKTLYLISGNPIPRTHDPGKKIEPILDEFKKINPEIFKNALIDPFHWIKEISEHMEEIHFIAMYGDNNIPASDLFTKNDAEKYCDTAFQMMILILIIAFQFGFFYKNLPEEGRLFFEKIAPGFFKKREDRNDE